MTGTLLFVCADNLVSHYIGGYKALSSALRKYQHCLATDDNMASKFTAESFISRTRHAHQRYVEELSGSHPDHIATTYGVARDSILNSSAYFHVVDGLVPDVLHGVLEGVLQYGVKLLLHHLILHEKSFTLDQLNHCIQSFDYGYHMSKDKPSLIATSRFQSTEGNLLGQPDTVKTQCLR